MATYVFRCVEHGEVIHEDRVPPVCFCGEQMVRVYVVPYISAAVTPSSRPNTAAALQRERDWGRDMPAYKRLVDGGNQPSRIDGAARMEARANTDTELKMGKLFPIEKVREGAARSAEILGHDVEV